MTIFQLIEIPESKDEKETGGVKRLSVVQLSPVGADMLTREGCCTMIVCETRS